MSTLSLFCAAQPGSIGAESFDSISLSVTISPYSNVAYSAILSSFPLGGSTPFGNLSIGFVNDVPNNDSV